MCEVVDVVRQEKIPAYLKAFESLLDRTALKAADVEAAGSKVGIGRASAYAALARYRLSGSTADLPPPDKIRRAGEVEAFARCGEDDQDVHRRSGPDAQELQSAQVPQRGRPSPGEGRASRFHGQRSGTGSTPFQTTSGTRRGVGTTRPGAPHDPLKGSHPDVGEPLASLQIDHWKADIEILDDDRTTIIGRVWITLAIDVFSAHGLGACMSGSTIPAPPRWV